MPNGPSWAGRSARDPRQLHLPSLAGERDDFVGDPHVRGLPYPAEVGHQSADGVHRPVAGLNPAARNRPHRGSIGLELERHRAVRPFADEHLVERWVVAVVWPIGRGPALAGGFEAEKPAAMLQVVDAPGVSGRHAVVVVPKGPHTHPAGIDVEVPPDPCRPAPAVLADVLADGTIDRANHGVAQVARQRIGTEQAPNQEEAPDREEPGAEGDDAEVEAWHDEHVLRAWQDDHDQADEGHEDGRTDVSVPRAPRVIAQPPQLTLAEPAVLVGFEPAECEESGGV